MPYHHLDPNTIPTADEYPCDRHGISDVAELSSLHAATYEMSPGEQLARTYHYHEQREELFYVLSGTVHIETPNEEVSVTTGEVFIAEPNSPHRAFVPADAAEGACVLGVGAPKSDIALPYKPDSE
jgi:mannose-6-phosphate isomerase-like protein (cupin superfamily)